MTRKALLVLLAFALAPACAQETNSSIEQVSVTGKGEIEQEPDMVTLSISIFAQKSNLAAAKKDADDKYRSVLEVINAQKIKEQNIKATQVQAQPQYDWQNGKRLYKGERVSRTLQVKILDLDKVSPLLQDLVENGVSTINSMQAGFAKPEELQRRALKKAADDATAKAKLLAEQFDRELGQAFDIQEQTQNHAPVYRQARAMVADAPMESQAPPPEMFGTQKITASVRVRFHLL